MSTIDFEIAQLELRIEELQDAIRVTTQLVNNKESQLYQDGSMLRAIGKYVSKVAELKSQLGELSK